jgi:hypothetical protein
MFVDMLQRYFQFLQSLVHVVNRLMGSNGLFDSNPYALGYLQIQKLGNCGLHHMVQQ